MEVESNKTQTFTPCNSDYQILHIESQDGNFSINGIAEINFLPDNNRFEIKFDLDNNLKKIMPYLIKANTLHPESVLKSAGLSTTKKVDKIISFEMVERISDKETKSRRYNCTLDGIKLCIPTEIPNEKEEAIFFGLLVLNLVSETGVARNEE